MSYDQSTCHLAVCAIGAMKVGQIIEDKPVAWGGAKSPAPLFFRQDVSTGRPINCTKCANVIS